MTDVINLRRERKRRKAEQDARVAQTNRVLHGRTKSQKQADRLEKARSGAILDGMRIENEAPEKDEKS